MQEDKIKLIVLGVSSAPLQSGAYALLLAQADGPYRIPLVIGAAEAQSIMVCLSRIVTPRPLTHDLFTSMSHAFGIELQEVFIYKFEDGMFCSELVYSDGEKEVRLDARASDAIAIALRTGAPIYTTRDVMEHTGSIIRPVDGDVTADDIRLVETDARDSDSEADDDMEEFNPEDLSDQELEALLERMIAEEAYEMAARIKEILKNRKS